jgi:hypothetical protein
LQAGSVLEKSALVGNSTTPGAFSTREADIGRIFDSYGFVPDWKSPQWSELRHLCGGLSTKSRHWSEIRGQATS